MRQNAAFNQVAERETRADWRQLMRVTDEDDFCARLDGGEERHHEFIRQHAALVYDHNISQQAVVVIELEIPAASTMTAPIRDEP